MMSILPAAIVLLIGVCLIVIGLRAPRSRGAEDVRRGKPLALVAGILMVFPGSVIAWIVAWVAGVGRSAPL